MDFTSGEAIGQRLRNVVEYLPVDAAASFLLKCIGEAGKIENKCGVYLLFIVIMHPFDKFKLTLDCKYTN